MRTQPAVWFPAVRTETGTDIFTERLANNLQKKGIRAEITWLPLRAEYAPWTVAVPKPPKWATVVHVNTWLHPRFLPKALPILATIHHAIHHPNALCYKGRLQAAYHKYWIASIERRVIRRANKVIAVSEFSANSAQKSLLDVPIQVNYNGIDTDTFKPGNGALHTEDSFRLLYVGGWKKLKGVDLLAPIMRELGNGFELYYTGGVPAEIDKPNMPSNMKDIGKLNTDSAVVEVMQKTDALLFPSRSEGFGLVAAEAMACGLPIVALEGTSVSEFVTHQINGYLYKHENIKEIAKCILNLKNNISLRSTISKNNRADAVSKLCDKISTERYIHCYHSLSV